MSSDRARRNYERYLTYNKEEQQRFETALNSIQIITAKRWQRNKGYGQFWLMGTQKELRALKHTLEKKGITVPELQVEKTNQNNFCLMFHHPAEQHTKFVAARNAVLFRK